MICLFNKKLLVAASFVFLLFTTVHSQDLRLTGILINATDNSTLVGATVKLTSAGDTLHPRYTTSDAGGNFVYNGLKKGQYVLNVTFVGFKPFITNVSLSGIQTNLGKLNVEASITTLTEVDVVSQAVRAEQKGDTAQYNADAFKVAHDANTEDLIKKMPGITIENGTVKAQGEEVKKVLVDGKTFFGDDASATLKNLPAEVVDKIQVFDKLSDQAAWTGFDDGNSQKTMNIVTRKNKNQGTFGKMTAGYGFINKESLAADPYQVNVNLNYFKDQRRLTLIGASNNINDQNFGSGDFLGSGRSFGRGGMRSFGSGGSGGDGITTTNALGLNFSNSWGTKLSVSGSYFYNKGNSKSYSTSDRAYIPETLPYKYLSQENTSTNVNQNHRMNLRLEYSINDRNSLIWTPRFNIQSSKSTSLISQDFLKTDGQPYGTTYSDTYGSANGINFNNEILYRYKFNEKGRTISLNIANAVNNRKSDIYLDNLLLENADTTKQYSNTNTKGFTMSGNLVYTEPIATNSQLQFNYNLSYSINKNDKKTYDYVYDGHQDYTNFNDLLSNYYTNDYITHKPGIGYLYKTPKVTLNAGLSYQYAVLNGNQTFPVPSSAENSFSSILPSFMLNYKFSDYMNLRTVYRANSNAPSISQLQQVIDNSNPMFVSIGNPDLKQEVRHFSVARFSLSNKTKTSNFFGMVFLSKTFDAISNAIYYAAADTTILGIYLNKGGQLSKPVNLDGSWSARTLLTFGFPVSFIKSNLNFNTGLSYNSTPSLINLEKNISGTYGINEGVVLSSNISENLDFTLTYNFTYNLVKNSLQSRNNNNYIFQIASTNFRWQFWKNLFVQTNLTYQNYNTISTKVVTDYTLWNASIGSKLFKNKAGEIKFTAFDILKQNISFSHNVTDQYIEDINSMVLNQYFILSFTYNLRKFTGEMPQEKDGNDRHRWDRMHNSGGMPPGPPPGMQFD